MKTYIVANTRSGFDTVVRSMELDRRDVVRIRQVQDVRGLSLQREQVLYAHDAFAIPDAHELAAHLDLAFERGRQQSQDDKRTHRLTVTVDGDVVGTRMVTARQAKDALG